MIKDFMKISLRTFGKRKLRSTLTLMGIVISIATIFVLISLSIGLENAVKEQFRQFGTDKIFIQPRGQIAGPGTTGATSLTLKDIESLEKLNGVKEVAYWVLASAKIKSRDETRFVNLISFDVEKADLITEIGSYKPDSGRLLKKGDSGSIMIGFQYKGEKFLKKGLEAGDKIEINGKEFKIEGILESVGNPSDDRLIYLPIEDFREVTNTSDNVDVIIIQTNEGEDIKNLAERIERQLIKSRGITKKTIDFTILTPEEVLESFGVVLNIITGFLLGVAAISLLVGGIGIANTMFTSVLERRKDIGVMKAIGAKNSEILLIFSLESGLLGLIGGIFGVILGIGIAKSIEFIAINSLGTNLLSVAFPIYLILGCLAFSFLSGAISGLIPAWQASKIHPVEALRYE